MNQTVQKALRAEDAPSFMRKATKAEREVGANPINYWSVEVGDNYSADVARGKAIAEELVAFLAANPTYGNMTLLGCMLVEMTRVGRRDQRGIMVGFGSVIGKLAVLGATMFGPEVVRRGEEYARAHLIDELRAGGQAELAEAFATGRLV